jgi:hypothetical protein
MITLSAKNVAIILDKWTALPQIAGLTDEQAEAIEDSEYYPGTQKARWAMQGDSVTLNNNSITLGVNRITFELSEENACFRFALFDAHRLRGTEVVLTYLPSNPLELYKELLARTEKPSLIRRHKANILKAYGEVLVCIEACTPQKHRIGLDTAYDN